MILFILYFGILIVSETNRKEFSLTKNKSYNDYQCKSILKNSFNGSGVHSIVTSQNQRWIFSEKLPKVPCGKLTLERCLFQPLKQKDLSTCKKYRLDDLVWGSYIPVSELFHCNTSICFTYPDINLLDDVFSNNTKNWNTIQPWITSESWLFNHLPNSWPRIPQINISHRYSGPLSSQMWVSILYIQLTEINRYNFLLNNIKRPQIVEQKIYLPVRSPLDGWMFRLKTNTYQFKF